MLSALSLSQDIYLAWDITDYHCFYKTSKISLVFNIVCTDPIQYFVFRIQFTSLISSFILWSILSLVLLFTFLFTFSVLCHSVLSVLVRALTTTIKTSYLAERIVNNVLTSLLEHNIHTLTEYCDWLTFTAAFTLCIATIHRYQWALGTIIYGRLATSRVRPQSWMFCPRTCHYLDGSCSLPQNGWLVPLIRNY